MGLRGSGEDAVEAGADLGGDVQAVRVGLRQKRDETLM